MKFTFARRVIYEAVYRDEVKKGRDFRSRMAKSFWESFEADMKALEVSFWERFEADMKALEVEVLKNAKVIEDKNTI